MKQNELDASKESVSYNIKDGCEECWGDECYDFELQFIPKTEQHKLLKITMPLVDAMTAMKPISRKNNIKLLPSNILSLCLLVWCSATDVMHYYFLN